MLTRRDLLKAGGAAGGALLLAPSASLRGRLLKGLAVPGPEAGAARASRLFAGQTLVHADLHNHTLLSDGDGDPELAFASMRDHGLDVAALTDHATLSQHLPSSVCAALFATQDPNDSPRHDCQSLAGIDEGSWDRLADLADDGNDPGSFVAIRGFEWSSPTLGHMNVWFSQDWTDPLHTGGGGTGEGLGQFLRDEGVPIPPEVTEAFDEIADRRVGNPGMQLFYEWLNADPSRPGIGGGLDGIAGFNHPGREVGRFGNFDYDPAVADRIVSMEIFNRNDDYLFEGTDSGVDSPLVQCLDAGWRVGLLGVTDEHGTDWGGALDKGRAGLWVDELTRDGVKAAMQQRRFFATNTVGLRLDAAATGRDGVRTRMGGVLGHDEGTVAFELDVDRGETWAPGKPLSLQVLRSGGRLPAIAEVIEFTAGPDQDVLRFDLPVDAEDGDWVVLRVSDPEAPADGRADDAWAAFGRGIAYASPFYLDPDVA